MINIRPVSDLRNKFPEIEETVLNSNAPVSMEIRRLIYSKRNID